MIVFLDAPILAVGEIGYVVFGGGGEGDLVWIELSMELIRNRGMRY